MRTRSSAKAAADFELTREDEVLNLRLKGRLSVETVGRLGRRVRKELRPEGARRLVADLSQVDYLDSGGVAFLLETGREARAAGAEFEYAGENEDARRLLGLVDGECVSAPFLREKEKPRGIILHTGEVAFHLARDAREMITFVGDASLSFLHALLHPRRVRWKDVFLTIEQAGTDALPIVGVIGLLIGLIMAFQAAVQLEQFGANIYVADLVALAMTREMGPLMTAILVAGRSGSAFTAEIGTMKVNEEIDALRTMGLDPVQFLVTPRLAGVLIVIPCLTLFSEVMGIAGGLTVGLTGLDLTLSGYLQETYKILNLRHVFSGLAKCFAFGLLVAGVGCLRGFQVSGGAAGVGRATTSSVVSGIFLVIIADAVFTVVYQVLGI